MKANVASNWWAENERYIHWESKKGTQEKKTIPSSRIIKAFFTDGFQKSQQTFIFWFRAWVLLIKEQSVHIVQDLRGEVTKEEEITSGKHFTFVHLAVLSRCHWVWCSSDWVTNGVPRDPLGHFASSNKLSCFHTMRCCLPWSLNHSYKVKFSQKLQNASLCNRLNLEAEIWMQLSSRYLKILMGFLKNKDQCCSSVFAVFST